MGRVSNPRRARRERRAQSKIIRIEDRVEAWIERLIAGLARQEHAFARRTRLYERGAIFVGLASGMDWARIGLLLPRAVLRSARFARAFAGIGSSDRGQHFDLQQ